MTTLMRRAIVCALLLPSLSYLHAGEDQPKDFAVHYIGGPISVSSDNVHLRVTPEALLVQGKASGTKKKTVYQIPLAAITSVVHSPVRFRRTEQVNSAFPAATGGGSSDTGTLLFGAYELVHLMALGIGSPMHGQRHYVSVLWQQEGIRRELVVEAGKDDYGEIITALQKFSGKKWLDLETEFRKLENELKRQQDKALAVSLDRSVKIGSEKLAPGPYRLVLLQREKGRGELYFFAGTEVSEVNLKAIALVDIAPAGEGATPVVVYTADSAAQIAEVRTAAAILRLRQP